MKHFSSFAKRSLSLILVLGLLLSNMSGLTLLASAANEDTGVTTTDGELVAINYTLSEAEAALLSSGLLPGDAHTYTVPTSSGLITVDAINKTVKAESYDGGNGYTWNPVSAVVYDSENVKQEDVALTDGEGTYTFDENAFSIQVSYSLGIDVDADAQTDLLKTAGWLKQGVVNLKDAYAANDNLAVVVEAMPLLSNLADGVSLGWATAKFKATAIAAVEALEAEIAANGELLMQARNDEYSAAAYKVQYLLEDGADYQTALLNTYNNIKAISEDELMNNSLLDMYLQSQQPDNYTLWVALKNIINSLVSTLGTVAGADWTAAEKGTALVKAGITAAEYATLETLVANLDTITETPEISDTLYVDDAYVSYNASMIDVALKAEITYYENGVAVTATKTDSVKLPEGATEADAAAKAASVENELKALVAELGLDLDTHFDRATSCELGDEAYYTVTYSPKQYTVTYDYKDAEDIDYGAVITLPAHENTEKAYDYTVNGEYVAQGEVVTVLGDITITRTEGKAYTPGNIMTIVGGNYGNNKANAILFSGALNGNEAVNVRYPDADGGNLVKVEGGVLYANAYPSSYENLNWMPYSYIVDGTTYYFNGATSAAIDKVDYQSIEVYYRLTLTNIDNSKDYIDLAVQLADEAEKQQSALATLSSPSVVNNLGSLNGAMLTVLKSLVAETTLNADADKDALLKNLFNGVIDSMKTDCMDGDSFIIAGLIESYSNNGLSYYYKNSDKFITEVEKLSVYLDMMLAADDDLTAEEKEAAVVALIKRAPSNLVSDPDEYAAKLTTLQTTMADVRANLTAPNAAIDVTSPNLDKLTDALTMSGVTAATGSGYPFINYDNAFSLAGSGKAVYKVTVKVGTNEAFFTVTYDIGNTLTSDNVADIMDQVDAKLAGLVNNVNWYKSEKYADGAELKALIGTEITASRNFSYEWVEKSYCEKFGHTKVAIGEAKEPTCTEEGITAGEKCSACGKVFAEQEVIPETGHTKETITGTPATCTIPGMTDGVKCSVCHETLTEQEEIPATGHDYTGIYNKDENGHWHVCLNGCGSTDDVVAHSYRYADCKAENNDCTVCGYVKKAGDHTWGAWIVSADTHKHICSSCKLEESYSHTKETVTGTPATCTIPGMTDGVMCTVCKGVLTAQVEIPATGHDYTGAYSYDANGHWHICLNGCGNTDTKADHTWDEGVVANGIKTYTCTACGATKTVEVGAIEAGEAVEVDINRIEKDGYVTLADPASDDYIGGYRYDYEFYVIDASGKKVVLDTRAVNNVDGAANYALRNEVKAAYENGELVLEKTLVNLNNEKLETLIAAMGEGVTPTTDSSKTRTQDGYYTGITANVGMGGLMDVVMALVMKPGFSNVVLGDKQLLDNGKVSVVDLVSVLINNADDDEDLENDNALTSGELTDMLNGKNKTLLSTTLKLNNGTASARSATAVGHEVAFKIVLNSIPEALAPAAEALTAISNWITFKVVDGNITDEDTAEDIADPENDKHHLAVNVDVDLPEKIYEIYVAALRLTGNIDENDVNAVETAVTYEFFKDYIDVLLGADVSTTTFANTAAKLGKTVELAEYEAIFNVIKGKLAGNVTYDENGVTATVKATNVEISKVLDKLEGMVNTGMMDTVKSLIKECEGYKENETVTIIVKLNAAMSNYIDGDSDSYIDTDFDALVIDVAAIGADGIMNKLNVIDFVDVTEETPNALADRVAALNGYAAIMLQGDVENDLVFNHATILDLNGHTLTGDITANATLIIIDSTMDTLNCGGVDGAVSGSKVTVLGGKYTADVTDYIKEGYVQKDGIVQNELYTVSVEEDGSITYNLNSDAVTMDAIPSVKALAIELAADIALNHFTAAAAKADGNEIYSVNFEDLVKLYKSKNTVDELLAIVKMDGIETFINTVIADCLDFAAIETAITNNENILSYTLVTNPWEVKISHVAEGDYFTAGIVPNTEEGAENTTVVNVKVVGSYADDIADIAGALADVVTNATATVDLGDPLTVNGKNVGVSANGTAVVEIDLTVDDNYAIVVGTILAYGNSDLKSGIVSAINADDIKALKDVVDTATVADIIASFKALNRGTDFTEMATAIGLTVDVADAADLEAAFHTVFTAVGAVLDRLGITGGAQALKGAETEVKGTYAVNNHKVNRNGAMTIAYGYGVDYTIGADVSVIVKLFDICEHSFTNYVSNNDATCEADGTKTAECDNGCGETDTIADEGSALGHSYGAAAFVWADDYTSATASITCGTCGNVLSGDCTVTSTTVDATCLVKGSVTYTAKITLNGTEYTDEKTVEDAYGEHAYGAWTAVDDATHQRVCALDASHVETANHAYGEATFIWAADNASATASVTCGTCNHTASDDCTVTSATVEATNCKENDVTTYTAKVTLNGVEYTDTKVDIGEAGEHTFGAWTAVDDTTHKRTCVNDPNHFETESHVYGEVVFAWAADNTATASITCGTCSHVVTDDCVVTDETVEAADCTEIDVTTYTAKVTLNGTEYTDTETVYGESGDHAYGTATFVWADDNSGATASITCGTCGDILTGTCTVTLDSVDATCLVKGSVTYTAKVTLNGTEYTDSKTVEDAYGPHAYGAWTAVDDTTHKRVCTLDASHVETANHAYGEATFTWAADNASATASVTCGTCNHTASDDCTVTSATVEATNCKENDVTTYTAKVTIGGNEYTDTKTVTGEAGDHAYGEAVFTWAEDNTATASITCGNDCGNVVSDTCTVTSATVEATNCKENDVTTYTAKVTLNGTEYTDTKTVTGEAGDHAFGEWTKVNSSTHQRVCANDATHVETASHSFTNGTCVDCGYEKSIGGAVVVTKPDKPDDEPKVTCNCDEFKDIDLKAWYHEYVCYAIDRGLMQGVGDGHFALELSTTRAMIVTLFYRLEGTPEVDFEQHYIDVPADQWYSESIAWATENGIAKGFGDETFRPDVIVTREQIAAFFHRYAEFKGFDVTARCDLSSCTDYEDISGWALDNVSWMVASELMVGTCTDVKTIAPQDDTTRAQLATMLKRFCEKYDL